MAKKKKKKWIAGAIKRPGALTRKAKAKNMSVAEYCNSPDLSTQSKRQCNLARTLKGFKKKKK